MQEGIHINRGLLSLGNVINAIVCACVCMRACVCAVRAVLQQKLCWPSHDPRVFHAQGSHRPLFTISIQTLLAKDPHMCHGRLIEFVRGSVEPVTEHQRPHSLQLLLLQLLPLPAAPAILT
eukprot:scaffold133859_cov25-Tisochrysis_lutea.AAC.1